MNFSTAIIRRARSREDRVNLRVSKLSDGGLSFIPGKYTNAVTS